MSDLSLNLNKDISLYRNVWISGDIDNNKHTDLSFIKIQGYVEDLFNYNKLSIYNEFIQKGETASKFSITICAGKKNSNNLNNVYVFNNEFGIDYYVSVENFIFLTELLSNKKARINIKFSMLADDDSQTLAIIKYQEVPFKILNIDGNKILEFTRDSKYFWADVKFESPIELENQDTTIKSPVPILSPLNTDYPKEKPKTNILFYVMVAILVLILIKI